MIKAIIFDCFGVLTADMWKEFLESLPDGMDIDRLRELNRQLDANLLNQKDFFEQVFELTGSKPVEVERLLNNEVSKNVVLLDYIRTLREREYNIGLLSNVSTNWVRDSFLSDDEQELFDEMVFSFMVGMTKPDPRIFKLTADKLGLLPDECVLVDDVEGNCTAAIEVGMQTVWYKNYVQLKKELEEIID